MVNDLNEIFKDLNQTHGDNLIIQDIKSILINMTPKIGILSLSSINNSILMWSHYADFHRGFCIGFKNNIGLSNKEVHKVKYVKDFKANFLYDLIEKKMKKIPVNFTKKFYNIYLLTKFIDWKYENEWRVIQQPGLAEYKEDFLDSIIFGLKMPEENRNKIRSVLKNQKINYFEATRGSHEFGINIQKLIK